MWVKKAQDVDEFVDNVLEIKGNDSETKTSAARRASHLYLLDPVNVCSFRW